MLCRILPLLRRVAVVAAAALVLGGAAPMQCPSSDRAPLETRPDAGEECYDLALRFHRDGLLDAWRATLAFIVERFPDTRWAARARDDLARGAPPPEEPLE